ncbi:uncharacterized protein DS421_20g680100 [Arachis hypogaea]|nr:uncharacterized protein DS421_20g680100 [Arachis hypogaea]
MRNQIMSTSLIVLFVVLFLAYDGGLVEAQRLTKCQAKEPIDVCTIPHCSSICDQKYSSNLGVASGQCLSSTVCNCIYSSVNPDCHAKDHLI